MGPNSIRNDFEKRLDLIESVVAGLGAVHVFLASENQPHSGIKIEAREGWGADRSWRVHIYGGNTNDGSRERYEQAIREYETAVFVAKIMEARLADLDGWHDLGGYRLVGWASDCWHIQWDGSEQTACEHALPANTDVRRDNDLSTADVCGSCLAEFEEQTSRVRPLALGLADFEAAIYLLVKGEQFVYVRGKPGVPGGGAGGVDLIDLDELRKRTAAVAGQQLVST